MITKEEIVEILCNHGGYMDRSRREQGVHEENFNDVADAILSKLQECIFSDSSFKELEEKLQVSGSYDIPYSENSIMKYGKICEHDNGYLCEHRRNWIIEFVKNKC